MTNPRSAVAVTTPGGVVVTAAFNRMSWPALRAMLPPAEVTAPSMARVSVDAPVSPAVSTMCPAAVTPPLPIVSGPRDTMDTLPAVALTAPVADSVGAATVPGSCAMKSAPVPSAAEISAPWLAIEMSPPAFDAPPRVKVETPAGSWLTSTTLPDPLLASAAAAMRLALLSSVVPVADAVTSCCPTCSAPFWAMAPVGALSSRLVATMSPTTRSPDAWFSAALVSCSVPPVCENAWVTLKPAPL